MSRDYAGRGRGHDVGYAPPARAVEVEPQTPAERAELVVSRAVREVASIQAVLDEVRSAHESDDPARWLAARSALERRLASVSKSLASARAETSNATPAVKQQLEAAKAQLDAMRATAEQAGKPPTGWAAGPQDAALLAAFSSESAGPIADGFDRREGAVCAAIGRLSAADCQAMARRIERGLARLDAYESARKSADPAERKAAEDLKPSDPIVEQLARWKPERRGRVLAYLKDARRRAARAVTRSPAPAANGPAARGVAGAGSPLPYLAQIQASFGAHDVSGVRAHVGGAAAEASAAIGAQAYATGDAVAFSSAPDAHTAAHEAAHAVQQQHGVQLAGGIDRGANDAHERHADEVADRVVRGESAEALLDALPRATAGGAVVQRKASAKSSALPDMLRLYVTANEHSIRVAIVQGLGGIAWPQPAPRLSYVDDVTFGNALARILANSAELSTYAQIEALLYPDDPAELLGPILPVTDEWQPTIGMAFVHSLERAIAGSLRRLGPRYLAAADALGMVGEGAVTYDQITTSQPIDRYVGRALTRERTILIAPPSGKATRASGPLPRLRQVKLDAVGAEDPKMWNWVRVTPADATPEEVAAALWHGQGEPGSYFAYRLAAAAPLYGLPKSWALANKHTAPFAPPRALIESDQPTEVRVLDAASSRAADQIALQQAASDAQAAGSGASAALGTTWCDCSLQLAFIGQALTPWCLADRVLPAEGFVLTKLSEAPTLDEKAVAGWLTVATAQEGHLYKISGAIKKLTDSASRLGATDPHSPQAAPIRRVLEQFASAAGASHLRDTCEALLQRALDQQAALDVQAVQGVARDLDRATADSVGQSDSTPRCPSAARRSDRDAGYARRSSDAHGARGAGRSRRDRRRNPPCRRGCDPGACPRHPGLREPARECRHRGRRRHRRARCRAVQLGVS